jgi:hypothetical protein
VEDEENPRSRLAFADDLALDLVGLRVVCVACATGASQEAGQQEQGPGECFGGEANGIGPYLPRAMVQGWRGKVVYSAAKPVK